MLRIIFFIVCFLFWNFFVYLFNIPYDYDHFCNQKFLVFILIPLLSYIISLIFLFFVGILVMKTLKPNHSFKNIFMRRLTKFVLSIVRIKVIVKNPHLIPVDNKLIIYANHKTWFDAFILLSISPRCLSFTPKNELYHIPLLSSILTSMNCIKIFRNNTRLTLQSLLQGIENAKKGLSFVVFPEGGIKDSTKDKLTDVLPGSLKIALKSEADILPISIKGNSNIRKCSIFARKKIEVYIHPILKFADYRQQNTHQISKKMKEIINSVL